MVKITARFCFVIRSRSWSDPQPLLILWLQRAKIRISNQNIPSFIRSWRVNHWITLMPCSTWGNKTDRTIWIRWRYKKSIPCHQTVCWLLKLGFWWNTCKTKSGGVRVESNLAAKKKYRIVNKSANLSQRCHAIWWMLCRPSDCNLIRRALREEKYPGTTN